MRQSLEAQPIRCRTPATCWLLTGLLGTLLSGCGEGALVTLGEQRERARTVMEFVNVEKVDELAVPGNRNENPTLSKDMLEIFFESRDRTGGADDHAVWYARRDSIGDEFAELRPLANFGADGFFYASPAISLDANTLWLARRLEDTDEDDATTDVYFATRAEGEAAFSAPQEALGEGEWNTDWDERPRPLGDQDRVMPLSRRVDSNGIWQTWFAERRADGEFEPPVLQDQLDADDVGIVDAFLSQDGLTLIFQRQDDGRGDLYWSKRRTTNDDFVGTSEVLGVNTEEHDERDPWLSADGRILYFVSNRDGSMDIYRAELMSRRARD